MLEKFDLGFLPHVFCKEIENIQKYKRKGRDRDRFSLITHTERQAHKHIDIYYKSTKKMVAHVKGKAPDFKKIAVVDGIFEEVTLSQYRGKYVVLAFVPNAFTYICPTEIIAYSESVAKFRELNCQILFVSTDSHFCLSAWTDISREEGGLGDVKVPLLSDSNHRMSRDYGVLFEEEGIALRGLFIIDPEGIIKHITVNDTPVGRNVEETLRIIHAFQSNDRDGSLLPCNWHPGDKAIMPDFDQFKKSFDDLELEEDEASSYVESTSG